MAGSNDKFYTQYITRNNNLILREQRPMGTSSTLTLKLRLDHHEVCKTTLTHVQYN